MNNLSPIYYSLLSNCHDVVQGTFTRQGGTSLSPFNTLNLSFDVGDDNQKVQYNCNLIQKYFNLSTLMQTKQMHGTDIYVVENPNCKIPPCDVLITKLFDVGLMIKHADCQTALIYDPIQKVIAAVHAGWRGLISRIYTKTIHYLKRKFNSKPENLLVCISPSLGKNHGEFKNYKKEFPKEFWEYEDKEHFDFWDISYDELIKAKILPMHIEISRLCTYNEKEKFFSYRREKVTGRNGTLIALKK